MAHELSPVRRPLRVRPAPRSALVTCAWLLTVAIQFVATPARAQTAAAPAPVAADTSGLADLDATTFSCAKAGLNAAAREARKAPSQGTYQFSYFRIANDAHHAAYEVHFKSNYPDEKELQVLRCHLLPAGMGPGQHPGYGQPAAGAAPCGRAGRDPGRDGRRLQPPPPFSRQAYERWRPGAGSATITGFLHYQFTSAGSGRPALDETSPYVRGQSCAGHQWRQSARTDGLTGSAISMNDAKCELRLMLGSKRPRAKCGACAQSPSECATG